MPEVVFGNANWLYWVCAAGVAFVVLTIFAYGRSTRIRAVPLSLRTVAFGMRVLGVALLLFCLLDPMGTSQRPKPQSNVMAILMDNSQSMSVLHQQGSSLEGKEDLRSLVDSQLKDDAEWTRKLSDDFRVRRYRFSNTMEPTDTLQGFVNNGTASQLYHALGSIRDRYQGQPLAGVILFTDGMSTDLETNEWITKLGYPVYPVRLGGTEKLRDIRIASVTTRQSDFEAAPVTMQASLSHTGFAGEPVVVSLMNSEQKVQESKERKLGKEGELTSVEFRFRPEQSGVQGYKISVQRASESKASSLLTPPAGEQPPQSNFTTEATLGNNTRYQVIDRGRGPYKILYFAGRPNWEFKFIRRALAEDDEIKLTSLIRIANKQPKFNFRESKVESSNPLFSGFEDISDDEKQKYDEPVYVRLGLTETDQLKLGFPKQSEELFEYSAVILDDLEAEFLSQADQSLLRQFVTVRGGSLIILGGTESMRGKGFHDSILSQMLPFYGDSTFRSSAMVDSSPGIDEYSQTIGSQTFHFQLTREGWLQPFLRLADNEALERKRLESMPPFEVITRVPKLKPGASVLVEASDKANQNLPVLITHRFGKGRTAALTIGDMWRWGLHDNQDPTGSKPPGVSPLSQSWRQMIRWLIADVPHTIEMQLIDPFSNGKAFRLRIDVKGSDFQAVDNANVQVTVNAPTGKTIHCRAEPSLDSIGSYEATVVGDQEGGYSAIAEVTSSTGKPLGSTQLGWAYEPLVAEYQSLGENLPRLESLAIASGGEVLALDGLRSFVDSLVTRRAPVVETRIYQLWHQGWVLAFAIGCLVIEWGIRRRYGMA